MQPKECILDIYGGFGRELGGWIPVATLIDLLADFRIDEQAARAAITRMKRSGLLDTEKRAGLAGYALTDDAVEILADGDRRLFRQPEYDGRWLVVTLSVPEQERRQRYQIKSRLARLGFGQGPANTWLAPAGNLADAEHMLRRHGLDGYVTMWLGEYAGFGELAGVVGSAWDLAALAGRYREYIRTAGARHQASGLATGSHLDAVRRQAFIDCISNLNGWRPLVFLDPGLPSSVTPDDWPAERARRLFLDVDELLRPLAGEWFRRQIAGERLV